MGNVILKTLSLVCHLSPVTCHLLSIKTSTHNAIKERYYSICQL
ncbi:hypothetical protein [Trichormus sp. NMC-1]|nr:hypothetical protein [Trichormus sp. NMC-1]